MKETILRFPNRAVRYSGRFGRDFVSRCFKTDAELETEKQELLNKIKSIIGTEVGTRATKDELKVLQDSFAGLVKDGKIDLPLEALRSLADEKTGVMASVIKQGLEINDLKAKLTNNSEDMSVRGQVKAWHTRNKAKIDLIKAGTKVELEPLEIRAAASPMLVSTVNSGNSSYIPRFEIEPGVNELVRPQPVFWDYLTKGRTNSPVYIWVNKHNPQGAAAFIAPGVAKPGISFELITENSVAKKIAESLKASTELLEDIDGMVTFINTELTYQLNIKLNTTLMTGTNSSTVPAGIQTLAISYGTAPFTATIKTTNPNYMDALRAAVAQLRSGWLKGTITIFINSVDGANMDLTKATSSGVYMLPPFVTSDGRTIAGCQVVEDNNVAVGSFGAYMLQYYRILIYKDYTVTWGWENDDFTKNLVTVVAEMRLHQFFNDQYTGAFLYDTFANVIAAITA